MYICLVSIVVYPSFTSRGNSVISRLLSAWRKASWKPLFKKKIHKENKDINVVNEYLYLFPLLSERALVFDMAGVLSWKLPINVIIVSMGWRFILEITNKC